MKSKITLLVILMGLAGYALGQSTNITVVSQSNTPAPYVVHSGTIPAGSPVIAKIGSALAPTLDPQAGAVPAGMVPVVLTIYYDKTAGTATFSITYQ